MTRPRPATRNIRLLQFNLCENFSEIICGNGKVGAGDIGLPMNCRARRSLAPLSADSLCSLPPSRLPPPSVIVVARESLISLRRRRRRRRPRPSPPPPCGRFLALPAPDIRHSGHISSLGDFWAKQDGRASASEADRGRERRAKKTTL